MWIWREIDHILTEEISALGLINEKLPNNLHLGWEWQQEQISWRYIMTLVQFSL